MKIKLSKKFFTKVFYRLQKVDTRFCVLYGGSGSSKSYSMHQFLILKSFSDKYDTLIVRKTGASIRNSVYKGIKDRISQFKLTKYFKFTYSGDNRAIVNLITGRAMVFTGLDDVEKIKSSELIGRVFIEEANQITKEDFLELNRRVRGVDGIQMFLLLNPVSIHHWIKKHFIDTKSVAKKTTVIKVTYKDNPYMTADDIQELENLKEIDYNDYLIYALGEWGNPQEGLIFREGKHWGTYKELPEIDFHETYGLDFGGGANNPKRKVEEDVYEFDEADGSSTTVLVRLLINKATMTVYVRLLLYKAYISPTDLTNACAKFTVTPDPRNPAYKSKKNILADNARADLIRGLVNDGVNAIAAKTKEGGSGKVKSGIDIVKKYKIMFHVDDTPAIIDAQNYRWEKIETGANAGMNTGNPIKRYENVWDAVRYALVNFDLKNF